MGIKTGAIKVGGSEVYPHTALDQIRKSATSSTTLIASGGVIKKDYLELTGLISASYVSSANIIPASAINGLSTAVNNAASTYLNSSGIIPASAINGLPTAVANAASTYVHSSGVIPTSAVVDLPSISSSYALFAENGWTRWVSAGAGVTVTENSDNFPERDVTIALRDYDSITTIPANSTTVTLEPGKAYKIDATTTSKTLNISAFNAGLYGRESHIELFVANAGYVHVGSNVTLVDALEPDAVNDCTVRFHDGHAIISVEDHVQAYMVNNTSTTNTNGSLLYGIAQTGDIYKFIGFRSELNTSTVPTGGGTATTVKHFVGNGMDVGPTISGAIKLNSNGTFRDCKLNGLVISAGTATLTNVLVDSGATVRVSGGGLAIETVNGNGGTIDLGKTAIPEAALIQVSGVTLTNGLTTAQTTNNASGGVFRLNSGSVGVSNAAFVANSSTVLGACAYIRKGATMTVANTVLNNNNCGNNGGCFYTNGVLNISSCTFSSNTAKRGGILYVGDNGHVTITDSEITSCNATTLGGAVAILGNNADLTLVNCYVHDNGETNGAFYVTTNGAGSAHLIISGSTIQNSINMIASSTSTTFSGTNVFGSTVYGSGSVIITSGATLDLTGNTNATPIAPGGGITLVPSWATILYGSTESPSSCKIAGATIKAMIGNDGSFVDDASHYHLYGNATVTNLTFKGTRTFEVRGNYTLSNCVGSQTIGISAGCSMKISGTYSAVVITGTNGTGTLELVDGAVVTMPNANANTAIAYNVGTVVVGSGCTINGNAITPGTYTSATIKKNGTITTA